MYALFQLVSPNVLFTHLIYRLRSSPNRIGHEPCHAPPVLLLPQSKPVGITKSSINCYDAYDTEPFEARRYRISQTTQIREIRKAFNSSALVTSSAVPSSTAKTQSTYLVTLQPALTRVCRRLQKELAAPLGECVTSCVLTAY